MSEQNGSSTKMIWDTLKQLQDTEKAKEKRIQELEKEVQRLTLVCDGNNENDEKTNRMFAWYEGLNQEQFAQYWHNMRRMIDAFERDDLFNRIYSDLPAKIKECKDYVDELKGKDLIIKMAEMQTYISTMKKENVLDKVRENNRNWKVAGTIIAFVVTALIGKILEYI